MRITIPTKDGVSQFNDISVIGYTTGQICSRKNVTLVVNGIIKNLTFLGATRTGEGDPALTPLIPLIDLYEQYGFEYMVQLLEGEFSIILLDHNLNKSDSRIYIAQDRLGLCPLYAFMEETTSDRKIMGFANTAQQLHMESILYETKYKVYPFEPGTYSIYEYTFKVLSYWKPVLKNVRFVTSWPKNRSCITNGDSISTRRLGLLKAVETIREALKESICMDLAVCWAGEAKAEPPPTLQEFPPPSQPLPEVLTNRQRRIMNHIQSPYFCPIPNTGGGPIGCLLSGGVDSSIVTALLRDLLKLRDYDPNQHIHTFTMGFAGASDLKNAKKVAEYLETKHDELVLTEDVYMAAIPKVVEILETADIATVRYGVALYLLLQRIHDTTPIRDIFTGDGADEAMGGFLNFYYMKDMIEHDYECNRLLQQYHRRGALYRKLFDHFGMRWYKPFLNDIFLSKYMSIPIELRYQTELGFLPPASWFSGDKNLLRVTFSGEYYKDCWFRDLLPSGILWRTEEPGYDGIGSFLRPLSGIIRGALGGDPVDPAEHPVEPIEEMEYYKSIHTKLFSSMQTGDDSPPYKYSKNLYEPTMRNLDVYLDLHLEYQDRSL